MYKNTNILKPVAHALLSENKSKKVLFRNFFFKEINNYFKKVCCVKQIIDESFLSKHDSQSRTILFTYLKFNVNTL